MIKLLHADAMTAQALTLYAAAKNVELATELADPENPLHATYLGNKLIGHESLPLMLLSDGCCIGTTRSVIDYIEDTRRLPRILSADNSPNPAQVATIHMVIAAIQRNLYQDLTTASKESMHDWATMFADFYAVIDEGQKFLDELGFSILDCFFFPATTIYLDSLPESNVNRTTLLDYRDRVLARTKYANSPAHNPDFWDTDYA